uniref:Uncharacterized protein n=1 Tax=Glossina morsitans morsitans TaxID=37546 RepID=A0A1B0G8U8_GLOMM
MHVRDPTCYLLTFGSSRHDSKMIIVNTTSNNVIELRTKTEQTPQQNECGKTLLKSDFADTQAALVEGDTRPTHRAPILIILTACHSSFLSSTTLHATMLQDYVCTFVTNVTIEKLSVTIWQNFQLEIIIIYQHMANGREFYATSTVAFTKSNVVSASRTKKLCN